MNKTRYSMVIVAIFLALALSALNVTPAFADESTPPTEETVSQEESVTSEEVVEETESTVTEEEAGTPPADEEPFGQTQGEPESATESESPSVAEVIESLPEDTTLVVVDENGEALPLASEEAAEIIEVADPQWCPVGVTPGAATCSGVKSSFNGTDPNDNLIQWLKDNQPNKAGVIWIEAGYVGTLGLETGPVVLDGSDYATMDNFALTINGGWTGTGTALNPNTPSTFNVPFNIINWTSAITINNIVVEGASGNQPNLFVQTSGNILVNNIDVQNNTTDYGASLNNTSGAGTVTVNDSTFNDNTGISAVGLEIYSNNTVTGKNISAMGNTLNGLYIYNGSSSTPKAVTLNGTNHFNYNGEDGLRIITKGAITLNNVTAMGNTEGSGAYLSNSYSSTVYSAVIIKGTNNFSDNGWDGLRVYTYGAITISNITANDNGTSSNRDAAYWYGNDINDPFDYDHDAYGKGVYLYNWNWSGKPQLVTLTGTNTFNGNASNGLYINSNGMVKINNLTANENGCDPLKDLNTYSCAGAYISGAGVTITGYNFFIGNSNQGLEVYDSYVPSLSTSIGAITLSNIYAVGNGEGGVWAVNGGNLPYNVTITGTNTFVDNLNGDGLFVWSNGVVTLSNVTANGNDNDGVQINNTSATTPKAVVITGTNTFNNNNSGLSIYSYGAITTNNVTANFNTFGGVYLDNCDWDTVTSCLSISPQAVTMNGNNNTSENGNDGVYIISRGVITVNNLTSNNSTGGWGAYLDNQYDNAVAGVTLKGYTLASYNNMDGVLIYSNGAITTNGVVASNNGGKGVFLDNCNDDGFDNCLTPTVQPVTMNGNNSANQNSGDGINILSRGLITVNNITANENVGAGMLLWNDYINGTGGITQKGYATLLNNQTFSGLNAFSNGSITMSSLTSSGNGTYGAVIGNASYTVGGNVTIAGTNIFNNNSSGGLYLTNLGVVLLSNITANYNGFAGGVFIDNNNGTLAKAVTLNGNNTFNGNAGDGLLIESLGAIKVNNVMANNNTGGSSNGAELYNNFTIENQPITITGFGIFNGNGATGLLANSNGSITLANINANGNTSYGGSIYTEYNNLTNTTYANVTLTGVNIFNDNGIDGLVIQADGNITVSNVTANNNVGYGTILDNDLYANLGTTGIRTVTVSGVNMFNGNDFGLLVYSNGTVSLTRITANFNNDGAGLGNGLIVNTEGAINLTCGSMYSNADYGYDLIAGVGKVVTIKGVFTYGNPLNNSSAPAAVITRSCPLP